MDSQASLAGRLLLALPGMFDPRFARAVIAMCVHDRNGAMGLCLGRQHDGIGFHRVLAEAGIAHGPEVPDAAVLDGGPVEPQRGFVLHSRDWEGADTIGVGPLGALSFSREVLVAIAAGGGPQQWLFALGYAGWGAGQLENELRHHGWHAASAHPEILFDVAPPSRWTESWLAEGIDPALLAPQTGHA